MPSPSLTEALASRRSVREYSDRPVELAVVRRLIEVGQAATNDDGKRAAPSAHALYPVCLYLAAGRIDGLDPGLYRCDPDASDLTPLQHDDVRQPLRAASVDDQTWIEEAAFILTLCGDAIAVSTHFADQQPYGLRGERYLYLEAGAIAQNIMLQATAEGLGSVLVAGFKDEETARVLGLEPPLVPILHLCFGYAR